MMNSKQFWIKALYAVFLITPLAGLVWMVLWCSVPVPKSDDYGAILAYLDIPLPERLAHIADFHNEHRILTARIVFEAIVLVLGRFDFTSCMMVGALFLFGYGLLFRRLFDAVEGGKWLSIPFFWLIASFLNYDNVCWAMASASNVQVHFWALLSLLLATKWKDGMYFVWSLLCAVLATFSTGAGMSVWGALLVMAIHDRMRKSGGWKSFFGGACKCFSLEKKSFLRACAGVGVGCAAMVTYLRGFHSVSEGHPFSFCNAMLTFVVFIGSIIPIWSVALVLGICLLACIVWIIWRMPFIRNVPAFAFLAYLMANILSASIFRSFDPSSVLACRMRIVPVALAGVVAVLMFEAVPILRKNVRWLRVLLFTGVLVYLSAFTVVSYPALKEQNECLTKGISIWPSDKTGLWCEPEDIESVDALLHRSVDAGIYTPPPSE